MGNYIQDWEGHKSDFHNVTQYGSKMCHATVTGVTCDTSHPYVTSVNVTLPGNSLLRGFLLSLDPFLCGLLIYHLVFTAIVQYSIIFNSVLFHAKFWPKPCLIWASERREFHPVSSLGVALLTT